MREPAGAQASGASSAIDAKKPRMFSSNASIPLTVVQTSRSSISAGRSSLGCQTSNACASPSIVQYSGTPLR